LKAQIELEKKQSIQQEKRAARKCSIFFFFFQWCGADGKNFAD